MRFGGEITLGSTGSDFAAVIGRTALVFTSGASLIAGGAFLTCCAGFGVLPFLDAVDTGAFAFAFTFVFTLALVFFFARADAAAPSRFLDDDLFSVSLRRSFFNLEDFFDVFFFFGFCCAICL
ncbi:MAG: hypothetical protein AAB353_02280 [Candidatus Hydrogenedentota bacterium]